MKPKGELKLEPKQKPKLESMVRRRFNIYLAYWVAVGSTTILIDSMVEKSFWLPQPVQVG